MVWGESERVEYFLIEKVKMHNDMTAIIKLRQIPLEEKSTRVNAPLQRIMINSTALAQK